jgi:hypothetical protein
MATGSVAAMLYGRPRMTHDIDLVIHISGSEAALLCRIYPPGLYYCPPVEAIQTEIGREAGGHFNVIHLQTGFKADFYPVGKDELIEWGLRNKRTMKLDTMEIRIAPPEYVIIQKLRYFQEGRSSKHLTDIQAMLDLSAEQIDQELIGAYVKQFSLESEWSQVKAV